MTPREELAQWLAMRQGREKALAQGTDAFYEWLAGPGGNAKYFAGESLSKEAKALFKQRDPATGKTMALNPATGQYDIEAKGPFSHWETWVQLGLGAGLGAVAAIPALLGAGAASAAAPSAAAGSTAAEAAAGGSTGILSKIGSIFGLANDIGGLFSANAAGRASGAEATARATQNQDRNAIDLYQALLANNNAQNTYGLNKTSLGLQGANVDLNQRQFALAAPGQRAGNAVRGDILSRAQDVNVSGISPNIPVPTISGGLRPSMFSPDTRALGADMTAQARAQQAKSDTFAPLPTAPDWNAPPAPPTLTGLPDTGLTSGLGTVGSILGGAGTFADFLKRYAPKTKAPASPGVDDGW